MSTIENKAAARWPMRNIMVVTIVLLTCASAAWSAPKGRFSSVVTESDPVSVLAHIPDNLHAAIAAGTDNTDLSAYVQAAANAARYGTLEFPLGRYHFDNVTLSSPVVVRGMDRGTASSSYPYGIRTIHDATPAFIVRSNSSGIIFDTLNIQPSTPGWLGMKRSVGVLFEGNVAAGAVTNIHFRNVAIVNFGAEAVKWNDTGYPGGPGWMIDTVKFTNCTLLGRKCFYSNAGNATNIKFDTTSCNIYGAGSIGYEIPIGGTFTWDTCWVGTPNPADSAKNGTAWKIGLLGNGTWINTGEENPRYGVHYTGAGRTALLEGNKLTFINHFFSRDIFNGSTNISSIGSTFCGDVLMGADASVLHWESVGDSFSRACNTPTPHDNDLPQGGAQFVAIPSITMSGSATFRRNGTLYTGPGSLGVGLNKSPRFHPKTPLTTGYAALVKWDDASFPGAIEIHANIWCDKDAAYSIKVGSSVDNTYGTKVVADNVACTAGPNVWSGTFPTDARVSKSYFRVYFKASDDNVAYFSGTVRYVHSENAAGILGGDDTDLYMNSDYHY